MPDARLLRLRVAIPPVRTDVPKDAEPLRNATLPMGTVPVEVSVAVRIMGWPRTMGEEADRVTTGVACTALRLIGAEVLAAWIVSPA